MTDQNDTHIQKSQDISRISSEEASDFRANVLNLLKDYIYRVCPPLLEIASHEMDCIDECLVKEDTVNSLTAFGVSADISVIFFGSNRCGESMVFYINLNAEVLPRSVAFVKCESLPITNEKPISSQLQIMTLGLSGIDATLTDENRKLASVMQQYTRNCYGPISRMIGQGLVVSDELLCLFSANQI
jgi:hypothetical protein